MGRVPLSCSLPGLRRRPHLRKRKKTSPRLRPTPQGRLSCCRHYGVGRNPGRERKLVRGCGLCRKDGALTEGALTEGALTNALFPFFL